MTNRETYDLNQLEVTINHDGGMIYYRPKHNKNMLHLVGIVYKGQFNDIYEAVSAWLDQEAREHPLYIYTEFD